MCGDVSSKRISPRGRCFDSYADLLETDKNLEKKTVNFLSIFPSLNGTS
jgi:hypothetical protein